MTTPAQQKTLPAMRVSTIFSVLAKKHAPEKVTDALLLDKRGLKFEDGLVVTENMFGITAKNERKTSAKIEPYMFSDTVTLDTARYFF